MNSPLLRLIGILLLVAAVVAAVLNLHRVADLRMPWSWVLTSNSQKTLQGFAQLLTLSGFTAIF
jgi:hypothetical protein